MNKCGTCSLCCKVMRIEELDKPEQTWCANCTKQSCSIYDDRPQGCRDFNCVWLQTQGTDQQLPPELRPDRCHVVLDVANDGKGIVAHTDKNYPDAWKSGVVKRALDYAIARGSNVTVVQ